MSNQLEISAKSLRSWLRSEWPRSEVEHGKPWEMSEEMIAAARARFSRERRSPETAVAVGDSAAEMLSSAPIVSRREVLARPCPVPSEPGFYGWWFRELPLDFDTSASLSREGLTLLYVGISPRRPSSDGKSPSQNHLRKRVTYHYRGNAGGSTLRKTLGVLLEDRLGTVLRRVGSGRRLTFADREQALSEWMEANAYVSWTIDPTPWNAEERLIKELNVPLNLEGNGANAVHATLRARRAEAVARAGSLPVVP